jgi:phenylalanyl-tRNA synthetase alpha subunit
MRQRTSSVANIAQNASTITTIPEAPPLPSSLSTTKPKTSWPSTTTVLSNTSTNTSPLNTSESSNISTNETRRRKTSSSDSKTPRKDSDSQQQQQQQSFDSSDISATQSPTSSSSIHFIQRTLNQHALHTIIKGRLRHLGYMAANITDFDLLNWLKTHKYEDCLFIRLIIDGTMFRHESALIIPNYPETLKALHMEFNWPFPVLISPSVFFNPIYRL